MTETESKFDISLLPTVWSVKSQSNESKLMDRAMKIPSSDILDIIGILVFDIIPGIEVIDDVIKQIISARIRLIRHR